MTLSQTKAFQGLQRLRDLTDCHNNCIIWDKSAGKWKLTNSLDAKEQLIRNLASFDGPDGRTDIPEELSKKLSTFSPTRRPKK